MQPYLQLLSSSYRLCCWKLALLFFFLQLSNEMELVVRPYLGALPTHWQSMEHCHFKVKGWDGQKSLKVEKWCHQASTFHEWMDRKEDLLQPKCLNLLSYNTSFRLHTELAARNRSSVFAPFHALTHPLFLKFNLTKSVVGGLGKHMWVHLLFLRQWSHTPRGHQWTTFHPYPFPRVFSWSSLSLNLSGISFLKMNKESISSTS